MNKSEFLGALEGMDDHADIIFYKDNDYAVCDNGYYIRDVFQITKDGTTRIAVVGE